MSTTITWSAILRDRETPCVVRRTTQIFSMVKPDPQDAAATALRWWLQDYTDLLTNWADEIGDEETEATVHVVIHDPSSMAGVYNVHLERKITALGYQIDADDAEEVRAKLADIVMARAPPAHDSDGSPDAPIEHIRTGEGV